MLHLKNKSFKAYLHLLNYCESVFVKKKSHDNITSKLRLFAKHTICPMHSELHCMECQVERSWFPLSKSL